MRFIHTADLHLGRIYKGELPIDIMKIRKEELWQNFENTVNLCIKEKIDLLLISGDVYEREYFTVKDIRRFAEILNRLKETECFILPGNHDYIDKDSLYYKVDFNNNIHIFNEFKYVDLISLGVRVHGVPWNKSEININYNFELSNDLKNIIMIHGTVKGKDYCPVDMEKLKNDNISYIALGHIHKREKISENCYYPGSPEGLNFKETGNHGIIVGEIDNNLSIGFINTQIRKYNQFEIELKDSDNITYIKEKLLEKLEGKENDLNRINFKGNYNNTDYLIEIMKSLNGFFYNEFIDNTDFIIDVEQLYKENSDNIIGEFIDASRNSKDIMKIGLKALMEEQDDN